nr:phage tail fiber-like protein [uncultured Mediterranean phage uvMED]
MTSKIVVNNIEPDSGISSVTFTSNITGEDSTQNISGINSVTASAFYGDGSNLTGAGPTLANGVDNRVVTATGANALNGEANLTFDGTTLTTNGSGGINISSSGSDLTMNSAGGIFTGNGGNANNPIVANVSDTNTGFFYPAADTIAVTTGGSERLRIDNYGNVTRPFQYHLHADRTGSQTGYNAGGDFGTPMIFNQIVSETKDSSLSSCFNTSNGLFTAPVTGVYIFNAAAFSGSGNIFGQSWFTLNGNRCSATDWVINSGYAFIQNTQVIRLASGNTVGFKPYASGQSNVTIQANNNHCYFKVSLIG